MDFLPNLIQASIENGFFGTVLLMVACFFIWKMMREEKERGREFGIKFAAKMEQLILENSKALEGIIRQIEATNTKFDIEMKHNGELRESFKSDIKEFKNEIHTLSDKMKDVEHRIDLMKSQNIGHRK